MPDRRAGRCDHPVHADAATPAMTDDIQLSFSLPSVSRKKVTAAFDGGRPPSDRGVMLWRWPTAAAKSLARLRRLWGVRLKECRGVARCLTMV
jgi:hypothetical protein